MHDFVQTLKQHNFLQNQKSVNSTVMKIKFTSKLSKTLKQLECIIGSLIKKIIHASYLDSTQHQRTGGRSQVMGKIIGSFLCEKR